MNHKTREEFESVFSPSSTDKKYWMRRSANGDYRNSSMQSAWKGWQAATARSEADHQRLLECVEKIEAAIEQLDTEPIGQDSASREVEYQDMALRRIRAALNERKK
jgi:hypothetical protein